MLSVPMLIADPRIGGASHLDQERVARYAEILAELPPIVVFRTDDGLMLADGYHRVAAADRAGVREIAADVREGSRRDVLRFAVARGAEERGISEAEVMERLMSRHSAERPVANDYDSFAEAYTAETEDNLVNGHYERPAILELAGDVRGRRILDAGCGSGPLLSALRDRGATVTGVDSSSAMLELARRRLGDDAVLHHADLRDPLPFPDGAFDDVIASLVLHYLEDWSAPLAELRRVLTLGGRLVAAVDHPLQSQMQAPPGADYLAVRPWSFEWTIGGHTAPMTFWHRPLHAMTDAFTAAGFRIAVVSEPPLSPDARETFADQLADLPSGAFLGFLFFVLDAVAVS